MKKQILMASALLLPLTLWGCISLSEQSDGGSCILGDCQNGYGELKEPDGKYMRVSQGTFKDGKLWDGKVNLTLANMDAILFQEVVDGKVIWQRPYGH